MLEGSGLKPFDNNSSTSFINNSIAGSLLENSIKKSYPNSKLSLENSIKNIKIKNLTVKNLEKLKDQKEFSLFSISKEPFVCYLFCFMLQN